MTTTVMKMERNVRRRVLQVFDYLRRYPDVQFSVEQIIDAIHIIEGTRPDRRAIYLDILAIESLHTNLEVIHGRCNMLLVRYCSAKNTLFV